MSNLVIVYDDSQKPLGRVKTILGSKSFGEMVLKRESMRSRFSKLVKTIKGARLITIKNLNELQNVPINSNSIVVHILSSAAVVSSEDFAILLEKLFFVKEKMAITSHGKTIGAVFEDYTEYQKFVANYVKQQDLDLDGITDESIIANCFIDLSNYDTLLMYISGGFDARYFNSLQGDNYTVTKTSHDKKKMKSEYSFYWLLPEKMKSWMVMPYDYSEDKETASYTMERMPMTDIAIRWTHGAIDNQELNNILDKVFKFFSIREQKTITKDEYLTITNKLYLQKVRSRIANFKKLPAYKGLSELIKNGTDFSSIDEVVAQYEKLYSIVTKACKRKPISVIGHGDVFFANMLYSKELGLLRLIDPKGALTVKELWTDPYYDIAKLSHSICGNYDFFNTGAYSIKLSKDMKFELSIHNNHNSEQAKELFCNYLKRDGYDYRLVRLYEASLFLSMLPLHIDNPHKVLGFILNAINILKEIETYV